MKINKQMLDMLSNMNDDDLKMNLQKVSQALGGKTTPEELMQKLKDSNILKKKE